MLPVIRSSLFALTRRSMRRGTSSVLLLTSASRPAAPPTLPSLVKSRALTTSTVRMRKPDVIAKDQEEIEFEAELLQQLEQQQPNVISGTDLVSLVQQLPLVVNNMMSCQEDVPCAIISCTTQLLKEYPRNYDVHVNATLDVLGQLQTEFDIPELHEFVGVVARKVNKLSRSFTDAESWKAVGSLRHLSSDHAETLLLVKAIANKFPIRKTKIEFLPMDDALIALRGLSGLDSDHKEVQELILAINFRLRHKKGKLRFFSSFQDSIFGVRRMSSARPEVRELLAHLVDIKYRWDTCLPPILSLDEDEEEKDDVVRSKRSPSRFRLDRLNFDDGQEVVDFIRVLGKKTYQYSQFHALYKRSDRERESPYLDIIAYLELPVHTSDFVRDNATYITAHHEAGHIVASHLLTQSPAEAIGAKISKYASYTTFRPKDIRNMDNFESSFMDKQAVALGGLAAEYLLFGAISSSAGNHDFRTVIDAAKEQLGKDGTFIPKQGSSLQLFFKNIQSMLWVVSGSLDRGGEEDWLDEHILKFIETQFFRVFQLLRQHEGKLQKLGEILVEKKSLSESDIRSVLHPELPV